MAAASDLNLVFGMIALQCDFISKDQLLAGMQSWIFDKARALGDILVEQKALPDDTRLLLDALVQKHLAQHGGQVDRSLAVLSSRPSVREAMEQIPDADLHATLARAVRLC